MKHKTYARSMRIIFSIAAKDVLDMFKSRFLISMVFGVLALILAARFMPLLISVRARPVLALYGAGGAGLFQALDDRDDMQVHLLDSQQDMEKLVMNNQQIVIGLEVPLISASGGTGLSLDGFFANWSSPAGVEERVVFFENVLSQATGRMVQINLEDHSVFPAPGMDMHLLMITQSTALLIFLMGVMLVPYLFQEERQQQTLDALLISPAGYTQLVVGKALAGMIYCLVASFLLVLFNFRYIVHWDVALLAFLLGSVFAVMIGLLLGMFFENQSTMGLWMGFVLLLLVAPPLVASFAGTRIPSAVMTILSWAPGSAFVDLLKLSMYGMLPTGLILKDGIILAIGTILAYALLTLRIRTLDR